MSQTSSKPVDETDLFTKSDKAELKSKIEKVLSETLSDKYNAKITLRFTKKEEQTL